MGIPFVSMVRANRTGFVEALHVLTLFSFAAAQPIYDILARNPAFLIAHRVGTADLLLLVFVVSFLGPAGAILVLNGIRRLRPKSRRTAVAVSVTILTAAIFLPPVKLLPDWLYGLRAGAALLAGGLFAWSYARSPHVRGFVTALSPAVILFPIFFLAQSPFVGSFPERETVDYSSQIEAAAPVVFVVFDELPTTSLMDEERNIDADRYPNFARMASRATWYRNAVSVADNTTRALPAIVTGNYPKEGALPLADDHPDSLFSLLGGRYRLNVLEPASGLFPGTEESTPKASTRRVQFAFDVGLIYLHHIAPQKVSRKVLPPFRHALKGFGDPGFWMHQRWLWALSKERPQEWLDFVERIPNQRETDLPSLNFAHVLLPHSPFQYLPSGTRYTNDVRSSTPETGRWESDEQAIRVYYRHLLQLGFVDRLLGELIGKLERTGLFDRALIVITGDHGISFRPGDSYRALSATNVWDVVATPLFIKAPDQQEGRIDDSEALSIDILPTAARLLGIELPWETDGRPLPAAASPGFREFRVYSDSSSEELQGFQREGGWYVFSRDAEPLQASLERKLELFGSGAQEDGFFFPVFGEPFLGRPLKRFKTARARNVTVELDHPNLLGQRWPRDNFLKTRLSGRIRFSENKISIRLLLIAVDGVLCGAALPDSGGRFGAVLPDSAFSKGGSEIRLFIDPAEGSEKSHDSLQWKLLEVSKPLVIS